MNGLSEQSYTQAFLKGITESYVVALAVGIFGFVFGVLAHLQHLSNGQALLMSLIMYSGSAQLIAIKFWHPLPIPLWFLIGSCYVITLRFSLMSMTLRTSFAKLPQGLVYLSMFFIIDENWALTLLKKDRQHYSNPQLFAYFSGSGLSCYMTWVSATAIGIVCGHYIQNPNALGLDFAFTTIFLALAVGFWRGKRDLWPWIVAASIAILSAHFIPGNWYIILGALSGSILGAWRELH